MDRKISDRLADILHTQLPPDLQGWFDGESRALLGDRMYNDPLDPEELILGKGIWGSMMPPDVLPLAGNGAGDYLCAKFNPDGTLFEIVAWHHENCHWNHYGNSLSQALAFDVWNVAMSEDPEADPDTVPQGISPVASLRVACELALQSRLYKACSTQGGRRLAESVGVPWIVFRTWLFDPSRMPSDKLQMLAELLKISPEELVKQDWQKACESAMSVIRLRADLAWPYTVVGWAHEKVGETRRAIDWYGAGFCKLGSTASFTETWTTTPKPDTCRFCVRRLLDLAPPDIAPGLREYLTAEEKGPLGTRSFWMARADSEIKHGQHDEAYRYLYFAGWDSFCSNDIPALLQSLATAAKHAGLRTLEALALLHLGSV